MKALCKDHGSIMLGWRGAKNMNSKGRQIEEELQQIRKELEKITKESDSAAEGRPFSELLKYMAEEREKTNRLLAGITEKVQALEKKIDDEGQAAEEQYSISPNSKEIPLSPVDASIINYVQTKGMACADEIKEVMHYRGRNAACARLNKLYRMELLERFQLGHKVFYRFNAGKATTSILIVSPPQ